MEVKQKKQSNIVIYLKNLSKKDKIILASTLIVSSIALALRFVILPQMEEYSNNLMTLDAKRMEQVRVAAIPKQNELLEVKAAELQAQYDIALTEISKTPEVAKIIYDLKDLIKRSGIEMKSLSFSETDVSEEDIKNTDEVKTDENGVVTEIDRGIEGSEMPDQQIETEQSVKKQVVNISLTGEYEDVISFIKSIEYYSRIADVSNISLSPGEDKKLNVSLTANFYNLNYSDKESYDFNNGVYGKQDAFN